MRLIREVYSKALVEAESPEEAYQKIQTMINRGQSVDHQVIYDYSKLQLDKLEKVKEI